jgi:RNA polymerase sigma factor (sigma-70 family)
MHKRTRFGFAARGAQVDFERLVRPHLDYLYKLAYRFTGAADRAEDLMQDLLVRMYPRCDELARVEQLRPWLVRVMYRLFIDQKRHAARAPYVAIADSDLGNAEDGGDPYDNVADDALGPDAQFDLNLDRKHLLQAWEQLSDEHKALLALYEIEGYTLNELESLLEVARGTLKSRLHRARARLAELLAAEPFTPLERVKGKRGAR